MGMSLLAWSAMVFIIALSLTVVGDAILAFLIRKSGLVGFAALMLEDSIILTIFFVIVWTIIWGLNQLPIINNVNI